MTNLAAASGLILIGVEPCPYELLASHGYAPTGFRGQDRTFNGLKLALVHKFALAQPGTVRACYPSEGLHDVCFYLLDGLLPESESDALIRITETASKVCKAHGVEEVHIDKQPFDRFCDLDGRRSIGVHIFMRSWETPFSRQQSALLTERIRQALAHDSFDAHG